jgi:calpain
MLISDWMWTKPTLEVCKSLIMLRDSNISGRLSMKDLPALLNMLLFWKVGLDKKKNEIGTKCLIQFG